MNTLCVLLGCLASLAASRPSQDAELTRRQRDLARVPVVPGIALVFHDPAAARPAAARAPLEATRTGALRGDFNPIFFPDSSSKKPLPETPSSQHNPNCLLELGNAMFGGQCNRLLTQASCAADQWLVLFQDDQAQCVPRPCPYNQLLLHDQCRDLTEEQLCGRGMIPYTDLNGHSLCDCQEGYNYFASSGACYAQHEEGPCGSGKYLELSTSSGELECVVNPCQSDQYILEPNSNTCYLKTFSGYCDPSSSNVMYHPINQTAECIALDLRGIIDVVKRACLPGTLRDHNDTCREGFSIPAYTRFPASNAGCPFGSIKVAGFCRRTQRFG